MFNGILYREKEPAKNHVWQPMIPVIMLNTLVKIFHHTHDTSFEKLKAKGATKVYNRFHKHLNHNRTWSIFYKPNTLIGEGTFTNAVPT